MEVSSSNALMEKLYNKFPRRPWSETMKLVRLCMDKPHRATSTATSDSPIMSCLEKLERNFYAKTLSAVVKRLEYLSKEKGLDSYVSPSGRTFCVTNDTFYIEIHLEDDGAVKDVKVAHPAKSFQTCEDLLQHLRMQNYNAFRKVLEELLRLYRIPGDSSTKFKGSVALRTLEKDLCSLSVLHRTPDMDQVTEILCGKVGYIRPRTEGIPLSIEFYLSPYQLLDKELTPDLELSGMKVFLTMGEADETHTFPLSPLIVDSVTGKDDNSNFLPLTEVACVDLLACFFLTFYEPFPMSLYSLQEIQKLTGIPVAGLKPAPLHELIIQLAFSEKCKNGQTTMSKYFNVMLHDKHLLSLQSLPDIPKQNFFINTNPKKSGAMINNLPFVHCKCVPDMIEILRRQAVYNTLVSSCISADTERGDSLDLLYYEVAPQDDSSILVIFQHPIDNFFACVSIDILSSREVKCTLHTLADEPDLNCSNDFLTKVIKRCMSIPILMRAIFKRGVQQKAVLAIQSTEGPSEQNPIENEESEAEHSWFVSSSSGDHSGSFSPERNLSEINGLASQCSSLGESASAGPSSAGMEDASSQSSGVCKEESASLEPSGGKRERLFLGNLQFMGDNSTVSFNLPANRMEDFCTYNLFSPESLE